MAKDPTTEKPTATSTDESQPKGNLVGIEYRGQLIWEPGMPIEQSRDLLKQELNKQASQEAAEEGRKNRVVRRQMSAEQDPKASKK